LTIIQSEYDDRMTTSANNTELGKIAELLHSSALRYLPQRLLKGLPTTEQEMGHLCF